MKIEIITFKGLHSEEHFRFHIEFSNLTRKYTAETLKIKGLFGKTYLPGFQKEKNSITNHERRSPQRN